MLSRVMQEPEDFSNAPSGSPNRSENPYLFVLDLYLFIRWEKRAETEIGDGRKEEVETQEKICGRACFFCSLLCIIPLKIYASRGENYSTNDNYSGSPRRECTKVSPAPAPVIVGVGAFLFAIF